MLVWFKILITAIELLLSAVHFEIIVCSYTFFLRYCFIALVKYLEMPGAEACMRPTSGSPCCCQGGLQHSITTHCGVALPYPMVGEISSPDP